MLVQKLGRTIFDPTKPAQHQEGSKLQQDFFVLFPLDSGALPIHKHNHQSSACWFIGLPSISSPPAN